MSLSLQSTWLSLTNVIKPRVCTKSRLRLFIAALFLLLWCQSAVDGGLSVKPGQGTFRAVQTQCRRSGPQRLIRICTVCLNSRKFKGWMKQSHVSILHSGTVDPPVLPVLGWCLCLLNVFKTTLKLSDSLSVDRYKAAFLLLFFLVCLFVLRGVLFCDVMYYH